jgi:NitT/TauT family transport system substrate-binding protein
MAITLQESLRGLFYAPFYAALARDSYAAAGVEVRFVSAAQPGDAATAVMAGAVDVCWGGPMRVMQAYHRNPGCDLVCFAEVVTRDPFLLVGRMPKPDFQLADLTGLRVATVSEVPTPWMCLQEDLRRAGLDPATLTRVTDRGMADNAAALASGALDVVQLFEPFVTELARRSAGHIWYAAAHRGPTSYTTFYARRGLLTEKRDEVLRMVRAIALTQRWIAQASGAEVADCIATFFPQVPRLVLAEACTRYKQLDIWGRDPVLARDGYDRLRASLVSGGFVDSGTPFEAAVDNSLAEHVRRELAGG